MHFGDLSDKPIITLENYTKWYNIYVIKTDGTVDKVQPEIIEEAHKLNKYYGIIDHLYHPNILNKVAELLDAEVDERASEVAAGRWHYESGCSL